MWLFSSLFYKNCHSQADDKPPPHFNRNFSTFPHLLFPGPSSHHRSSLHHWLTHIAYLPCSGCGSSLFRIEQSFSGPSESCIVSCCPMLNPGMLYSFPTSSTVFHRHPAFGLSPNLPVPNSPVVVSAAVPNRAAYLSSSLAQANIATKSNRSPVCRHGSRA